MKPFDYIYITRKSAIEQGYTHEGTMFGVPAWFAGEAEEIEENMAFGLPKVPALVIWPLFCDSLYEIVSKIWPGEFYLQSPIHIVKGIEE